MDTKIVQICSIALAILASGACEARDCSESGDAWIADFDNAGDVTRSYNRQMRSIGAPVRMEAMVVSLKQVDGDPIDQASKASWIKSRHETVVDLVSDHGPNAMDEDDLEELGIKLPDPKEFLLQSTPYGKRHLFDSSTFHTDLLIDDILDDCTWGDSAIAVFVTTANYAAQSTTEWGNTQVMVLRVNNCSRHTLHNRQYTETLFDNIKTYLCSSLPTGNEDEAD